MAEENAAPQMGVTDENTRRTLKLRPSNVNPAGTPLADPMRGETDTSNLDVLDDTQTRKTIKIKPLNPTAPQVNIGAVPKAPGATPLSGTQTRKAVVIKSQAAAGATPLSGTQTRKAVVIAPQAAAGATPLSGTQTRKTVVLKPVAQASVINTDAAEPAAPVTPAAPAPAAEQAAVTPAAQEEPAVALVQGAAPASDADDTVTRKATVIAATDDDKTVKISRPQINKPAMPDPKRTVKLGSLNAPKQVTPAVAPAPAVVPAPAVAPAASEQEAPAVEEKPIEEAPKPVMPQAAAGAVPVSAVPPAGAAASGAEPKAEAAEAEKNDAEDVAADEDEAAVVLEAAPQKDIFDIPTVDEAKSAENPSLASVILCSLALILLIGAVVFSVAQYLDYDHNINIYSYIPGLPIAGK